MIISQCAVYSPHWQSPKMWKALSCSCSVSTVYETLKMPQHNVVPSLLETTLTRIERLVTRLVLEGAHDIANKVCAVKEVDHEYIIEQTRTLTSQHVDEVREMIFDHVVHTLHQDVSIHILKVFHLNKLFSVLCSLFSVLSSLFSVLCSLFSVLCVFNLKYFSHTGY